MHDLNKLSEYGNERDRRRKVDFYQNMINIVHVASFHPEKGRNTDVEKLYNSYNESDHSYLNAKLDTKGLELLAQRAAANRAKAVG